MIHGAMPSWRLLTALRPSIDVSMNLEPLQAQSAVPGPPRGVPASTVRRGGARCTGAECTLDRLQLSQSVVALTVEPILILRKRMRRSHARSVGREE